MYFYDFDNPPPGDPAPGDPDDPNDFFTAELHLSDASVVQLEYEDVNTSTFFAANSLPLRVNSLNDIFLPSDV